tara:strand:- start:873 stop:1112 length:240 start_codon:yes stop_codon:yes gene_type:complete
MNLYNPEKRFMESFEKFREHQKNIREFILTDGNIVTIQRHLNLMNFETVMKELSDEQLYSCIEVVYLTIKQFMKHFGNL